MVQKPKAKRGRPRAYVPEDALSRVMDVFWDNGFAATSLDDLSAATGMNRPSLYAAFGDKRTLYRKALDAYRALSRIQMKDALAPERPLREALARFYEIAIAIYSSAGEKGARGCFAIGTALTEAVTDSEIRAELAQSLHRLDNTLEARIRLGQQRGDIDADANPAQLGQIASAMLYLLAIQARVGETRKALRSTMDAALDTIFASTNAPKRKPSQ